MGATLLRDGAIFVDDGLRAEAGRFVRDAGDRAARRVLLTLQDGSAVALPEDLSAFVADVLEAVSHGGVSVRMFPPELTTTAAAEILGVSRPTLMKWVRGGRLASHDVGSHHRFDADDVLALAGRLRAERDVAFAALRGVDEELEAAGVSA